MTDMYPTEEGMYPTEDAAPATTTSRDIQVVARSGPSAEDVARAREALAERQAAYNNRVQGIVGDGELPSLEALRDERASLLQQVRHHKDEHDSLALDIESHQATSEVFQSAARVQRYEAFAEAAERYTETEMPEQVAQVVQQDQQNSDEEIAAYIQELQAKREQTLKKICDAQNRSASNKGNASRSAPVEEDDDMTKAAIQHVEENVTAEEKLSDKVKTFRALKTKLQGELVRERKATKTMEESLQARVRNQELANARDARQCRELNGQNAILTTNSQMLLSQLNGEHYGYDQAPTAKQMIEERKKREATPEPTPANNEEGPSQSRGGAETASVGSRRQSLSKPPLVASKPTAAQRSRDEAMRQEREEIESRRRNSEAGSYQSSRRQSLSKPPLVASKATAAQRNRDEANRQDREQGSRQRSRGMSVSSEGKPPSVASKTTASQRNREAQ